MPSRAQYKKNPAKFRKQRREYYWRNRKRAIAATRTWYRKNRDKALQHQREYHNKHREKDKKYQHAWYMKHRDKHIRAVRKWAKAHPKQQREIRERWRKSPKGKKYMKGVGYRAAASKRNRRYYQRHLTERRKRGNEHAKRHYRKNRTTILKKVAQRRLEHPESFKAAYARWMRSPKGRRTSQRQTATRRAKLKAGGSFTREQLERKLKRYKNCCARCHQPKKLDLHHVVPLASGGLNVIGNILPLCKPCHLAVHRKLKAKAARAPARKTKK